jgi:acyl-coenzyme A synthetase/AMP-(fatty) acid ligase
MSSVLYTGIYAFVTLKERLDESEDEIKSELRQLVREQIAAYAVPDVIQVTDLTMRL